LKDILVRALFSVKTLFIPHGWSYLIHALEDSVGIIESKQTVGSIELAAANLPENQVSFFSLSWCNSACLQL